MSGLHAIPAPTAALLRYLRTQSENICHFRSETLSSPSCHRVLHHPKRRCLSSSARRSHQSGSPRSSISDLFARKREKCKALPPQKLQLSSSSLSNRHASSDASPARYERPSWFRRLFTRRRPQTDASQQQYDADNRPLPDYSFNNTSGSYEETSAQLFNLSRTLTRSPAGTELKLRCTEFDADGRVTLVSGEFKKSELIAKYGLLPRDLRKIDSSVLPHILVRPTAILINLLHLRVLIQSDRVLVFDAYGSTDSYTQSLFMYDLEGKLRQTTSKSSSPNNHNHTSDHSDRALPYEFRALEAVLMSVTSGLESEFALVREPVTHILRALESDIDREKLRHLLIHSKKLGTFEQKARLVRDALYELLEADDDLASMYLSERKRTGKPRAETDHTEIEMLLESYHKICDEVVEISGNLISNIRNTEEVVKAILDANRNQLMLFEIKVSIATLGLAGGTLIAGFYGMNLENFIEETNWGFGAVTGFSAFLSVYICIYGFRKLRKVQKVRMWNEGGMDLYDSRPSHLGPSLLARREGMGYPSGSGNVGSGSSSLGPVRGNWRSEALEALALGKERERKMNARYGNVSAAAGQGAGPVLWPGMDGLGLHKLNSNLGATRTGGVEVEDTNSDADDAGSARKEVSSVKVGDDLRVGLGEKGR